MKKIQILILLGSLFSACNHEVFIEPLDVEPLGHTLEWTGGAAEFKANQDIDYIYSIIFRWVNGKGYPVDNRNMQFTLSGASDQINIKNDLCDLTLIKENNRLRVESGYNLFPDTIYMNIDISSYYETASRGLRIMPSPGFGHGEISYNLHQHWTEETQDTINLVHLGYFGEEPRDFIVAEQGRTVAKNTVQFMPYDKLVSDNIFGRTSFEVDEVVVKGWDWGISGKKIPYTSTPQHTSDSLVFNEDLIITLQPQTEYRVKAVVKSERYGFDYSLPAISPIAGLENKVIEGIFWIINPLSYEILIETNDIK